jgi:chromate reductase, NAD(P)H dehydrogenase (quinone)
VTVSEQSREPVSFLVFSATLRAESLNTQLARLAVEVINAQGGTVDHASMREFDTVSYDADLERSQGLPLGAQELRRRLEATDAFVIASPEYNASMPGVLKNAIDWVSRAQPQPFHERHGLLLSASPSMAGGNRGLWALRVPFEHLGARIYPDMFSLAQAHQASTPKAGSPTLSFRIGSTPRWPASWTWSKPLRLPVRENTMGRVPRRTP